MVVLKNSIDCRVEAGNELRSLVLKFDVSVAEDATTRT